MRKTFTPEEQKLLQVGRHYNQKRREQETDRWWRCFIHKLVEDEADAIMKEVNADPTLRDVQAPPEIWENLKEQIRKYESRKQ